MFIRINYCIFQDVAVPCYISGSTSAYDPTSPHRALPATWKSSRTGQYRPDTINTIPSGISSDILPFRPSVLDPILESPATTPVYDFSADNRLLSDFLLLSHFITTPVTVPPNPSLHYDTSPALPDTYDPTFDRQSLADLQLLSILLSNSGPFYSSSSSSEPPPTAPIAADPSTTIPVPVAVPSAYPNHASNAAVPGSEAPTATTPGIAALITPVNESAGSSPVVPDSVPVFDTTVVSPLAQITESSDFASTTRPVNTLSAAPIPQ